MFVIVSLLSWISLFCSCEASSFNFEISNHVLDVVHRILDTGVWPHLFSKKYFESGYADSHDLNKTGSLFYFLLQTNANARNVYMGWEDGSFVSVIRGGPGIPVLKSTFNLSGEYMWSYVSAEPGPKVRHYYEIDSLGRPTTFLKSQSYDHRLRPWYQKSKQENTSLWTGPLVYASILESGITYCTPVYLPNGSLDGILALDFALLDISNFLASQYAQSDRQVYIVDTQGYLIGSSTGIDLLIGSNMSMVTANASSDRRLTQIHNRLAEHEFQEGLVILESSYVQTAIFRDNSSFLNWRIWVSMPAAPTKDFLLLSDPGAIPVIVISAIACAVSITALCFVIWHRGAKIIRMSQRRLVGTFLTGCLLLNLSFFAYLGSNTAEECRFRSWWPNLMFTLAFAPILVKTWYMYSVFTKKMSNMKSKLHARFSPEWWRARFVGLTAKTFVLVLVEVIILLCATLTGEMDPYNATVLGPEGAYQTRTFCGPEGEGPFNLLDLLYKIVMVGAGCALAFATRHISSFLAESYSLAVIVYSISVFGLVVLLITKTATLEVETSFLLRTLGVCWSTTVSTIALLGPRFYKLLTIGDEAAMQWLRKGPLSNKPSDHASVSGTLSVDRPIPNANVDRIP